MPSRILEAIQRHAQASPTATALQSGARRVDYATLAHQVNRLASWLRQHKVSRAALQGDNSPEWVIADLACWRAGVVLVPVPPFFTERQRAHVLETAGIDHVLLAGTSATEAETPFMAEASPVDGIGLVRIAHGGRVAAVPPGTCKITFTSGTTGQPKGVCLDTRMLDAVADALATRIHAAPGLADAVETHFCLLPLATLLENVAGVHVPLLLGKRVVLRSGTETGLTGSSRLDLRQLIRSLHADQPSSLIVLPQILQGLVHACEHGAPLPPSLRFIAVGGATTPASLIHRARALGLPVFEGYGLSECASVVALNAPGNDRVGSVGRVLPHVSVRIRDGAIEVQGNVFPGYLGQPRASADDTWLDTGDLGHIDADGFLHVTGRRKNLLITSFGRNVSPEWVEAELSLYPAIAQIMVVGDGQPQLGAIVVPAPGATTSKIAEAIAQANQGLPDYARIQRFLVADAPFTTANQCLTDNGRLKRDAIAARHAEALAAMFAPSDPTQTMEPIHDVL